MKYKTRNKKTPKDKSKQKTTTATLQHQYSRKQYNMLFTLLLKSLDMIIIFHFLSCFHLVIIIVVTGTINSINQIQVVLIF